MNWIDLGIIIIVGLCLFKGFRKGLIHQAAFLFAIIVGIAMSGFVADWLGKMLATLLEMKEKTANSVAVALSFFVILGVVYLASWLITKFLNKTPLGIFNKLFGAALGGILALAILGYLFVFVDSIFLPISHASNVISSTLNGASPHTKTQNNVEKAKDIRQESSFYYPVKTFVPTILAPRLLHKESELVEKSANDKEELNEQ